jgi:hypothetical protein
LKLFASSTVLRKIISKRTLIFILNGSLSFQSFCGNSKQKIHFFPMYNLIII